MPRTWATVCRNAVDSLGRDPARRCRSARTAFARLRPVKVVVPAETRAGERRVAAVPESVARLVKAGLEVVVESGAGRHAHIDDAAYVAAGATTGTGTSSPPPTSCCTSRRWHPTRWRGSRAAR